MHMLTIFTLIFYYFLGGLFITFLPLAILHAAIRIQYIFIRAAIYMLQF